MQKTEQCHLPISVIIPVYNAEKYLDISLQSLKNQIFGDFEVLIVDDCSSDSSLDICRKYVAEDIRFKLFCHSENKGPGAARNTALKNAAGETVFFLDADDSLNPDSLNLLYRKFKRFNVDIVVGGVETFDEQNGKSLIIKGDILRGFQKIRDVACHYLKQPNKSRIFSFSWGRLFRRSLLEKHGLLFDESMVVFEDVAWNFQYGCFADSMLIIDDIVYRYRIPAMSHVSMGGGVDNIHKIMTPLILRRHIDDFIKISDLPEFSVIADDCVTNLIIIYFIRTCLFLNIKNFIQYYRAVYQLLRNCDLQKCIRNYNFLPGRSRFLPLFMRYKTVIPVLLIGKYKALKRYKKER